MCYTHIGLETRGPEPPQYFEWGWSILEPPKKSTSLSGGGALVFEVGYHPRKKKKIKNHVITVVFHDKRCTHVSFRGVKTSNKKKKKKKKKKLGVFLVIIVTNFGKDKLRKTHAKTRIQGLFSYLKNTCLGVFWKSFYEDDIQPPPPQPGSL